jgi:hypothetical protein
MVACARIAGTLAIAARSSPTAITIIRAVFLILHSSIAWANLAASEPREISLPEHAIQSPGVTGI